MPEPLGPRACEVCGSTNNVKMCARCHGNWYCGVDCQAVHWEVHEHLCTQIWEMSVAIAEFVSWPPAVLVDGGDFGWFWYQPEPVFGARNS